MEAFLGLILIVGVYIYYKMKDVDLDRKVNQHHLDIDLAKMSRDKANGVSEKEIQRRFADGYYDTK